MNQHLRDKLSAAAHRIAATSDRGGSHDLVCGPRTIAQRRLLHYIRQHIPKHIEPVYERRPGRAYYVVSFQTTNSSHQYRLGSLCGRRLDNSRTHDIEHVFRMSMNVTHLWDDLDVSHRLEPWKMALTAQSADPRLLELLCSENEQQAEQGAELCRALNEPLHRLLLELSGYERWVETSPSMHAEDGIIRTDCPHKHAPTKEGTP